jgi:hypothetical protein
LAFFAAPCLADTPYSFDVSDLWWNPSESGWGLNLAQQDDTVFATMFVYGPDGKPRWFSASDMKGSYASALGVGFRGRLFETVGPTQPGVFNSADVQRRDVGQVAFQTRGDNLADLTYTVNGVTVKKQVQRLTMKGANASGEYTGYRTVQGCFNVSDQIGTGPAAIRILQNASSFTMTTGVLGQTCTYSGTPEQRGRILGVKGTFACSNSPPGTFEISNMSVTYQGFMAHLYQAAPNCQSHARIGGLSNEGTLAGRASVDASDLWWNPDESGWGINIQQQDNIAFATIFTYGVDRQARWFSGSDLRIRATLPGGLPSFSGKLYESTGPGYMTSFNPAGVTRREVGDIYFDPSDKPDEAFLMYYVDGLNYVKKLKRLTMKENDSSGAYRGHYAASRSCPLNSGPSTFTEPVSFTVTQLRGSFSLTDTTANQTCTYSGIYEQRGRMLWSQGAYHCGGNLPEDGNYTITELEVGQEGLIAQIQRTASNTSNGNRGCTMSGRLAGVRPY